LKDFAGSVKLALRVTARDALGVGAVGRWNSRGRRRRPRVEIRRKDKK